jgi:hypothetical protein
MILGFQPRIELPAARHCGAGDYRPRCCMTLLSFTGLPPAAAVTRTETSCSQSPLGNNQAQSGAAAPDTTLLRR